MPARPFPDAAREALDDSQLRRNLGHATATIRDKRAKVVGELPDWEQLRDAGAAIKDRALLSLDEQLERLEESVTRAGGTVHWARDGGEANEIVAGLVRDAGADEVVKVKSIATDEIGLNEALEAAGIGAVETDLAELIIQLAGDVQSHILVPAIHLNRAEIRDVFARELGAEDLPDDPPAAGRGGAPPPAAQVPRGARGRERGELRRGRDRHRLRGGVRGQRAHVHDAAGGADHRDGDREGAGLLPRPRGDAGAAAALLDRRADEPLHLAVDRRDGGRRAARVPPRAARQRAHGQALADATGRQALRCIRCSACLNVCPVYSRTGGHAYGSVYPGPIGAILTPQLVGVENAASLPYASSLCGACYEVCPVKIDIPSVLVDLRRQVVDEQRSRPGMRARLDPERRAMEGLARAFSSRRGYETLQRAGRLAQRPLARGRDRVGRSPARWPAGPRRATCRPMPDETFREWWRSRR